MSTISESKKEDSVVDNAADGLNSHEDDFRRAKAFLLKASTHSGLTMYDHLVTLLKRLLEQKPENAVANFEKLSREVKRAKYTSNFDTVLPSEQPSWEALLADVQKTLFKKKPLVEEHVDVDDEERPATHAVLPNVMLNAFFFEQGGIGFSREETFRVWLALQQLVEANPLKSCRFWGKVYGTAKNYYIAEVEFLDDQDKVGNEETAAENKKIQEAKEQQLAAGKGAAPAANKGNADAAAAVTASTEELDVDIQELENAIPKPDFRPPPEVPREPNGTGANKRVYFVCHEPGEPWVRLPPVTPAQIARARIIRKFFTGNLDAPVVSYPPFPGVEMNYLRAQISRISAGTQISPQGYYQFNEEEEEEEEGAVRENFMENPEFEPMPLGELVDSSLASWVHSTLHILPQGRCQWWNPALARRNEAGGEGESDEGDEEQEDEQPDEPEPETGPPLLTPLSEDVEVDAMTPWTAKVSSLLVPHYAVAVISSNLWPGAHAFGLEKSFENIYIGWGLKYSSENHSPVVPAPIQHEFPSGPETTEVEDPTPEEEAAFRAAQAEAQEAEQAEEEGEEEEEEDEDD